jgi:hypothetical protein
MGLVRTWLTSLPRLNKAITPATRQVVSEATPAGRSRLETLPYEIRSLVFERLGYSHVYLPGRIVKTQEDEVYYSFSSTDRQAAAFVRRSGYKCPIVGVEYKHGEIWPTTTTVETPGSDSLVHIEGCSFRSELLHVSRTIREQVLTLLYRRAVAKFGSRLGSDTACRLLLNLTTRRRHGPSHYHFASIQHVELTEAIDKDARNVNYTRKSWFRNPTRGLTSSLQFIANYCPLLISLNVEPNHLALKRSQVRSVAKLVAAFLEVAHACSSLKTVRLGLREGVRKVCGRWVERMKFAELELADVEQVHRLSLVENWVTSELGYLTAIPPHIRFVPLDVQVWS